MVQRKNGVLQMNEISRRRLAATIAGIAVGGIGILAACSPKPKPKAKPKEANLTFTLHAKGAGKIIVVTDRIAGKQVYNDFLGPDSGVSVGVASSDGSQGDIDVTAQMTANSPVVAVNTDYQVRQNETLDVNDV